MRRTSKRFKKHSTFKHIDQPDGSPQRRRGRPTRYYIQGDIVRMRIVKILTIILAVSLGTSFSVAGEKMGILILAHGSKDKRWEDAVRSVAEPIKQRYPLEIAFGMADPATMQQAIDKLEAEGVTRIVVVPLFISSYSPIIRQNEYLLGLRKKLADPPMMMQHSSDGHESNHLSHGGELPSLRPLRVNAQVILTKALDDNPLVAEILDERINELSKDPPNETVILVAHGPNDEEDNRNWLGTMESIADRIYVSRSEARMRFKHIFCVTVRDDAEKAVHDQARQHLRSLVRQSGKSGDVIVIPVFVAQGGVELKIVERLEGLKYRWSGKTLLPHGNIQRFIEESVQHLP